MNIKSVDGIVIEDGRLSKRVSATREHLDERLGHLRLETRQVNPHPRCTGKTNTGNDVVILASSWINPATQHDRDLGIRESIEEALLLEGYLIRRREFFGYPVGKVHLVYPAHSSDLRDAIGDKEVSSIALLGHAGLGYWVASRRDVPTEDIAEWVKKAGHCKNGFGLKTGCNTRSHSDLYLHQPLSPAYSHPNHTGHMFIVRGKPSTRPQDYPGSEMSTGLWSYSRVVKLTPEHIVRSTLD